jgi:hypothetical protein
MPDMHLRLNTFAGDKTQVDATVSWLEETLRPRVELLMGYRGSATVTADADGYALHASYWSDVDAMVAADRALAPLLEQGEATSGGEIGREGYEVLINLRHQPPPDGGPAELARFEFPGDRIHEVIDIFTTVMLPSIERAPGLCGVQLLVDPEHARGIVATTWVDELAAHRFWLPGGELRARAARRRVAITFIGTDFYRLVHTSARLG